MTRAEALREAKLLFGVEAWVSVYTIGTVIIYTVASDPDGRVKVSGSSWEDAIIKAEEKLKELNGQY